MSANSLLWLDVKTEYIDANFDALLHYLQETSPSDENGFNQTFELLRKRVYEYMDDIKVSTFLHNRLKEKDGYDLNWLVRLFASYILASIKVKQTDHLVITALADVFLLSDDLALEECVVKDLYHIIRNCVLLQKVNNPGFSWVDFEDESNFVLKDFINFHFCHMQFDYSPDRVAYYENAGTLKVNENEIAIVPINCDHYIQDENKLFDLLPFSVEDFPKALVVDRKDRLVQSEWGKQVQLDQKLHDFILEQRTVYPSDRKVEKVMPEYKDDDILLVRFLRKEIQKDDSLHVWVESVDPAYKKIEGCLYIPSKIKLNSFLSLTGKLFDVFFDKVKAENPESDICFQVTLKRNDRFDIQSLLSQFYKDYPSIDNKVHLALFKNKIPLSDFIYLLENGVSVKVSAKDQIPSTYCKIRVYSVIDGKSVGQIVEELELEIDEETFQENALIVFLNNCIQLKPKEPKSFCPQETLISEVDILKIQALCHATYHLALMEKSTDQRYSCIYIARYLAELCRQKEDSDYIKFELNFQKALIRFARKEASHDFNISEEMSSLEKVKVKLEILRVLANYTPVFQEPLGPNMIEKAKNDEEILNHITNLSNSTRNLNGIVLVSELDKLKLRMSELLSVDDKYVTMIDKRDHDEEEGQHVEYKTSIVYPAGEKTPDYNTQLFVVLKAINGFLNSELGGTLWIGVKDNRNDEGVQSDIEELFREGVIKEKNMDKYRLELEKQIRNAFVSASGLAKNLDVVLNRVDVEVQQNNSKQILCIHVKPYEYDLIQFNPDRWPAMKGKSFVRKGASTVEVKGNVMKSNIEEKKRKSSNILVQRTQLFLKAIKDEKQVKLINYASGNNPLTTRIVEPCSNGYFPLIEAFACYEPVSKKTKLFKINRMEDLKMEGNWKYKSKHNPNPEVDIFGYLKGSNEDVNIVKIKMKTFAKNLFLENYPGAKMLLDSDYENKQLVKVKGSSDSWLLSIPVFNIKGVGNFIISAADFIESVSNEAVLKYVADYFNKNLKKFSGL